MIKECRESGKILLLFGQNIALYMEKSIAIQK